jgi:hypothetical protein
LSKWRLEGLPRKDTSGRVWPSVAFGPPSSASPQGERSVDQFQVNHGTKHLKLPDFEASLSLVRSGYERVITHQSLTDDTDVISFDKFCQPQEAYRYMFVGRPFYLGQK